MKLVSIKNSSAEAKEQSAEAQELEGPVYPYGLSLHLNSETLEKLGLDMASMKVGQVVQIQGLAKVTGTSAYEREGSEPESCVDLQLTDLGVGAGKVSPADKLYSGND